MMNYKNHYILLVVFLVYGFLLSPLGNYKNPTQEHPGYYNIQKIDSGDDTGYYAYLRSGIIDGDFDFFNERGYWHFGSVTATGYTINYWYIGQAILWSPFFMIGHGVAWFYRILGYPVATDGYSFPYHAFTFLASACEVFVALTICQKILEKFYSQTASLIATLLVFSSTCLPYFTFIRNRMSHSGDLLTAFVFFCFFLNFRDRQTRSPHFFIWWGICAGVLFDLRYSNLVYLILPCGVILNTYLADKTFFSREKKVMWSLLLGGLAFTITTLPQWITWLRLNGVLRPATQGMAITLQPGLLNILFAIKKMFFSYDWGIAFVEPIWLIGLAGLAMILKKDQWMGSLCWLVFLGCSVVPIVLGNGASFGQRYLISAFPVLAMGLGQVVNRLQKFRWRALVVITNILLGLWIYVLLLNYSHILTYNKPDFTLRALQNLPTLIEKKLLVLPTTYLDLYLHNTLKLSDFYDYFFIIIFPILFVVVPMLLLTFVHRIMNTNIQSQAMKYLSSVFLTSMIFLSVFIFVRHPELPPKIKKERLQVAAVGELIKSFSTANTFNLTAMNNTLSLSEQIAPPNERDYLIRADSGLLTADFNMAREFYLKAIAINDHSTANLQLERIDMISGEKSDIDTLDFEHRDDPTGDLARWMGIYYLDRLMKPEEAITYFKASLEINPEQKQAAGIKRLIAQYITQLERLKSRNIDSAELPIGLNLMLNTDFNEVRLTSSMIPHPY